MESAKPNKTKNDTSAKEDNNPAPFDEKNDAKKNNNSNSNHNSSSSDVFISTCN